MGLKLLSDRPHFNGSDYDSKKDQARLSKQHERIRDLMVDGHWRTLDEIAQITLDPAASVSAQLRHLRKERFGAYNVEKRRREGHSGLFEYRVTVALVCAEQMELI